VTIGCRSRAETSLFAILLGLVGKLRAKQR
jgi:hypothetical protein